MLRRSSGLPYGGGADRTRRFFLAPSTDRASSENDGATTTSVNTGARASASAAGTGRLAATMPPKADTGSHALAAT